jgi:hypothetical protein
VKLKDAETPEQVVEAVEDEDPELLADIRSLVEERLRLAVEDAETLSLLESHGEDWDAYWETLHETEWEGAIDEAWSRAIGLENSSPLLNQEDEQFNEWLWDKANDEVRREISQPENYHENVYVDLIRRDASDEEDEAPEGYWRVDVEPQKHTFEFDPGEPLEWVPEEVLDEIVEEVAWEKHDADMGRMSDGTYQTKEPVDIEDQFWSLQIDVGDLAEYMGDRAREWISELVDRDPEAAVGLLIEAVEAQDPKVARKLAKAKLPQEVLAAIAVSYFADGDVELIRETVGEFGYTGSRGQPMLHVTRADLAAMGITGGRLWDGAPWSLINLPSNELGYEGVRQRHCVGRHDMGYREAVDRGRIWVWSLRSQHNKPLLTWEVDRKGWSLADSMAAPGGPAPLADAARMRGSAIRQLKGKLNRMAGKDAAEAAVLLWIFARLGVDERLVRDFNDAYKRGAFVGGGAAPQPRADNPSFNRPCRA